MTRAEVTEIFAVLMMAYPNAGDVQGPGQGQPKGKAGPDHHALTTCLRDIDFWAAQQAVIRVCQTCKFPPTIAEMREAAEAVLHEVRSEISNAYLMARSELQLARLAGRTKEQALEGMPTRTQKVIEAMGGIDAFMPPDKKYFEMERFEQTYETMLRKNPHRPAGQHGRTATDHGMSKGADKWLATHTRPGRARSFTGTSGCASAAGRLHELPDREALAEYADRYCANLQDWKSCTVAANLLKYYERTE